MSKIRVYSVIDDYGPISVNDIKAMVDARINQVENIVLEGLNNGSLVLTKDGVDLRK
jgi:hypothetical protein